MQATAEATPTTAPKSAKRAKPPKPANRDHVLTRPITVAEYYRMGHAGIIGPRERVELLDGQLIKMPPIEPPHDYSVERVTSYFYRHFADLAFVKVQGAVRLDDWSEPQPDVTLNKLPRERYAVAHPTPADVLLVVEVAASSLPYDTGMKLRAYARRGVREYWIVDLAHERVDVYRDPAGERYASHRSAGCGESVAPLAFPEGAIAVDDILPPPVAAERTPKTQG